jgi:hypothetical protein
MFNIVEQWMEIENQTYVNEVGELVRKKPTHLLLNREHYDAILNSIGINTKNMKETWTELYGLTVMLTNVPLDNPRVLSL